MDSNTIKNKSKLAIFTNPYFLVAVGLFVVIMVLYMIQSVGTEADDVMKLYTSLQDKTTNSKEDFDKRIVYIKVDSNGNVTVNVEYKSELEGNKEEDSEDDGGSLVLDIPADAQAIAEKLRADYPTKADAMGLAYSIVQPRLGTEAAIGLLANIAHEGSPGLIEGAALESIPRHSNGQMYQIKLKHTGRTINGIGSGYSFRICDRDGLDALEAVGPGKACGLGIIQWSFNRRMGLIQVYKELLGNSNSIDESICIAAEIKFMDQELQEGSSYYRSVSSLISGCGQTTPEAWAEAFCDAYEAPSCSCNWYESSRSDWVGPYTQGVRMTYTTNPSAVPACPSGKEEWCCRKRAQTATRITQLLQE